VVWFSVVPIVRPVPSAMAALAATAPRARQANSARAIFLNRMVLPLYGLYVRDSRADLRSGRATVVHTYTKGNKPEYLFPNLGIPSKCASQRYHDSWCSVCFLTYVVQRVSAICEDPHPAADGAHCGRRLRLSRRSANTQGSVAAERLIALEFSVDQTFEEGCVGTQRQRTSTCFLLFLTECESLDFC